METYIARQPIIACDEQVMAYEVIYTQGENSLHNYQDDNAAKVLIDFFNRFDKNEIAFGKTMLITLTPKILKSEIPMYFNPQQIMLQIDKNILVNPDITPYLIEYKEKGFKLVLIDFEFSKLYLNSLSLFDMLKVDMKNPDEQNIKDQISLAQRYNMQVCGFNINSIEDKERAKELGVNFMQGESVAEMSRQEPVEGVDHLQSNLFRLTAAISNESPDFNEITNIISIDVTLTFALLRIVNSAYFGLRNQIKDIKQAISVLGIKQLRQWVYLLNIGADGHLNDELIKTSFMRANFCQEICLDIPNIQITPTEAYLLGMFSTIDIILRVNMKDAMQELNIALEIKDALNNVEGENLCRDLIHMCISYEEGKWKRVEDLAKSLNIDQETVREKYMVAIDKVNDTWKSLTK